jgi:uncharacterized membrane protein YfhO
LTLDVATAGGVRLTINTPYFPGWTLSLDGRAIPAVVQPEAGFMDVTVPPGRHTLDARLVDTAIRRWSNIVSAGSLSLFAIVLILRLGARTAQKSRRSDNCIERGPPDS